MRRQFLHPVFYALIYGLLLLLVWYFAYYRTSGGASENLLHYDARHYDDIAHKGYFGVNIAFFPLFPMLWRILHVSVEGVCVMNLLMFMSGFVLLARAFQFSVQTILLCLSLPLNVFFYVPYSEAVFFLSGTLILAGLQQKNTALWVSGFFMATLARPAFTVLLPAFALALMLSERNWKPVLTKLAYAVAATAAGMAAVGWVQYADTGEWFRFFSIQSEWDNRLRFPTLPLRSWGGDFSTRMDALAFFASLVCGLVLLPMLMARFRLAKASV
ncbi:MAG: hypothetical protein IT269_10775, partial [Saprospiraceae bacterium]|nr:hypothetical protein [Saprospiraceae bacterium]